jgi:hypothetical protein
LAASVLALGVEASTACSADKEDAKGQLVVAFETDMTVPDDIDMIRVQVLLQGVVRHDVEYAVGPAPDKNPLPATLAIVAGSDPSIPVTVRVIGFQGTTARVLRKAVTTVPTDRIALLQMPVQWLCWGDVDETGLDTFGDGCGEQTCVAGKCVDTAVDSKSLPSYAAANVFGGAKGPGLPGQCVDVLGCFDQGFETPVTPNPCRIQLPPGASVDSLNVGLVLPTGSQGICGPQACIVPLESDPVLGWQASGSEITLPQAVCDRIGVDIDAVAVTTACITKKPGIPICAPWSSVFGNFTDDASAPDKPDAASGDDSGDSGAEADTFVIPQSDLLGIECTSDAECGGITCLRNDSLAGGTAGPLGGLCSFQCAPNQDICGQVKPGAVCRELVPGEHYCVEGCTPGQSGQCSGHNSIVCAGMLDVGTQTQTHGCLPQCKSDANCSDTGSTPFCHQLAGLCNSTPAGSPSFGLDCAADAGGACVDTSCVAYPDPDGGTYGSACTSTCPIADQGACGGFFSGNACIWPEDPAQMAVGEAGQCMKLCNCTNNPCGPNLYCVNFPPFIDAGFKAALEAGGWIGYCGPPFGPNGEFVSYFSGNCS